MKTTLKKYLPYIAAAVIFIILAVVYASPEVVDNKVLQAGDQISGKGMGHEAKLYNDQGHYTWWTGSMFGGMPTYQIGGGKYPAPAIDIPYGKIVRLGFTGTVALILGYFIGFFIMLRAFKINEWLSIVGAIAMTLSSYFFVIIAAGHNAKVVGLAFLAPIIGGFYLACQKKYGWAAVITLIYSCLGVMQHPQMTYYMFMLIGVMACAELYIHIREKRIKDLIIAVLVFGGSFALGVGTQVTPFFANQEYLKETMRSGHSELSSENKEEANSEGLNLTYMTQYSYGIGETATLLIPGAKGYASAYNVGTDSHIYKAMVKNGMSKRDAANYCKNMPTYWGGDEGTSGPVYVGAIVCFLFVLGLCIVKGPYKWALLVATIFSILLSWGYNFLPLTEFFAKFFPMYNKFRAVESILVVAEVTMPLLGFLALKEITDNNIPKDKLVKYTFISAGITAGFCFLAFLVSFGLNYSWGRDESTFAQWPSWLIDSILAERASIFRASAMRSLLFVIVAAALVWLFVKEKIKLMTFTAILGILVLMDMWPIDKKFLNEDNFVKEKAYNSYFEQKEWEKYILEREKDNLSYRVYNLTDLQGPFNDSRTSYYLKSVGGYSAAKLRRYQDLIDAHITGETNVMLKSVEQAGNRLVMPKSQKTEYPVLNMLNMKYAVANQEHPLVIENENAMGNAWFVDSVMIAQTHDAEPAALSSIILHNTLVTDVKFESFVKEYVPHHDSTAAIKLTGYAPDFVEYDYSAAESGLVVFSEIYYPYGWNAYIDGTPAEHFRANYTLRAMNVPAGKHHIRFEFRPQTIEKWGKVAVSCKYVMNLIILSIIGIAIYRTVKKRKEPVKKEVTTK